MKSCRTIVKHSAARTASGGVLVLLLFLLGQASAVWHHAFVEHRVCSVDGELAHGDGHEHGAWTGSEEIFEHDDHGAEDGPAGPVLAASDEEGEHDEHCSFPPTRDPRRHPPVDAVLAAQLSPSAELVRTPAAAPCQAGIPIFRLAPKQSPPRRA